MKNEKKMLQLAYKILTDARNDRRYGLGFGIHDDKINATYTYWDMLNDMKEAYKGLQNRVLTLDELDSREFPCALWTEYRECESNMALESTLVLEVLKDAGYPVVHFQPLHGMFADDYLKSWRCWLRKPTDQERDAVPWD